MEPNARSATSNPIALSRLAGLCGIGFVLLSFLGLSGALGGNLLFSDVSPTDVLAWIEQNAKLISLNIFLTGLEYTLLYGGLFVPLVQLTHARGILPVLVYLGLSITIVTTWVQAGMIYAMVDLAARGGADAGVLALFTLGKTMQFTDGIGVALAIGCSSVLALRARVLPRWLAWYGFVVAVFFAIADAFRIFGLGLVGPVGVLLAFGWILCAGVSLLARPVRVSRASTVAAVAPA